MPGQTQEAKKVFSLTLNPKIEEDKKLMTYLKGKRITETLKQALHLMIEQEEKGIQQESGLQDLEGKVVLSENQFDKLIDAVTMVTNLMNTATLITPGAGVPANSSEPQLSIEEQKIVNERSEKAKGNLPRRSK